MPSFFFGGDKYNKVEYFPPQNRPHKDYSITKEEVTHLTD